MPRDAWNVRGLVNPDWRIDMKKHTRTTKRSTKKTTAKPKFSAHDARADLADVEQTFYDVDAVLAIFCATFDASAIELDCGDGQERIGPSRPIVVARKTLEVARAKLQHVIAEVQKFEAGESV
jgi:hypothetical protein